MKNFGSNNLFGRIFVSLTGFPLVLEISTQDEFLKYLDFAAKSYPSTIWENLVAMIHPETMVLSYCLECWSTPTHCHFPPPSVLRTSLNFSSHRYLPLIHSLFSTLFFVEDVPILLPNPNKKTCPNHSTIKFDTPVSP